MLHLLIASVLLLLASSALFLLRKRLGLFLSPVVVPLVPEHLAECNSGLDVFLGSCIRIKRVEDLD